MRQHHLRQLSKRICLLFLLLFTFCTFTPSAARAAGISVSKVQTVSGGKFVLKNNRWMYRKKSGSYAKNALLKIDGKTYLFSASGARQYSWKKIGGSYYYFGKKSEGYMYKSRWLKRSGHTYYLRKSGKRAVGFLTLKGKTYYFDARGRRLSGWQTIKGKRYYFGTPTKNWMRKSTLVTYKKHLYYLKSDGTKGTGWRTVSGKRYYFSKQGRAYTGKHKIGGTWYYFSSKGVLLHKGANLSVSSACAILLEADSGKVIYAKNETRRHANASTTKILTCMLALENAKLSDRVTVSANAAAQEPSKLYMQTGDSFYMKDLLYSLMLPSHNDTAVAVAEHISGSTEAFAELMNKKAKSLGCKSTHFVTPNGLDRGLNHYTTAADLAKIAQYAWKNSTFRKIVGTSSYRFHSLRGASYSVATTNALLGAMPGVTGMKTGYTDKAGSCFAGAIRAKNGKTYLCITLGASSSSARWADARKLLGYAYKLK